MPTISEHRRHMSILRAAIPYVMPESRRAIEILLQADALVNTARNYSENIDYPLESAEFHEDSAEAPLQPPAEAFQPDPENMLLHIQEFCSPRESDLIQTMLNFIRAGKLYRGYQEFQRTHPLSKQSDLEAASTSGNTNQLIEFLLSRLNPEQKTILEQMRQVMYNERCATPERTSHDTETKLAEQ